ncbi:MAG TPA: hypothetical protein VFQ68_08820 [Streptosporangiaceae bacterium]|nr:hypothetical protein [Streptosporangiaceae bacterium]
MADQEPASSRSRGEEDQVASVFGLVQRLRGGGPAGLVLAAGGKQFGVRPAGFVTGERRVGRQRLAQGPG